MHLSKLSVSGFMGFTGAADLSLDDIAPGVVAVIGANGEGKTRLMDAAPASLYGPGAAAAFPSREGTLADYATSRSALLASEWTLEDGSRLFSRVTVDGKARATDAWLSGEGNRPLNDGKVTTYREAVAARFPSRRQLLASAFAAQGRQGSFVGLDQKGRNELLAELLDLGHYAALAESAKRCASAAEAVYHRARGVTSVLEAKTSPEAIATADGAVAAALEQLAHATRALASAQAEQADLEAEQAAYAPMVAQREAALERIAALRRDVVRCEADLASVSARRVAAVETCQRAVCDAEQAYSTTLARVDAATAEAERQFGALSTQTKADLAALDVLLASADVIRADLAQVAAVTLDIAETELAHAEATRQAALASGAFAAVHASTVALEDARRQAAALAAAPFGERCAPCKFMSDAAHAVEAIPDLERTAATYDASAQALRDGDIAAVAAATRLLHLRARLRDEPLASASARSAALDIAAEKRAAAERRRVDAAAALERTAVANARALVEARVERDRRLASAKETREQALAACGTVEQATDRLHVASESLDAAVRQAAETDTAAASLDAVTRRLAAVRDDVRYRVAAEAGLARDVEHAELRLRELQGAAQELAAYRPRMTAVEDAWLTWRLLAQACGRDGVPRLEIDAAGPTVAHLCNDLLAAAFSSRFAIDLTTQVPLADGKGWKEEVAVRVLDQRHGGAQRDLTDLSGGERVVVEEALRSAIALFVNARGRQPVRTVWRDETTGALDPENVPRYVAMLRRLRQVGGIRHVLFVTHSETAASLADAVVRVANGVPTVERAA